MEAQARHAAGELRLAEEICREALRREQRPSEAAATGLALAAIQLDRGRYTEARREARRALDRTAEIAEPGRDGAADRLRVQALCLMARSHMQAGEAGDARPLLERALAAATYWLEPLSAERCRVLVLFGQWSEQAGHPYEAEEQYLQALQLAERIWDPFHGEVAAVCHRLAILGGSWEHGARMEAYAERAYEIRCALFGSTHPLAAASLSALAGVRDKMGYGEQAGEKYLYALALFDRHYASEHYGRTVEPELLEDYARCLRGAACYLVSCGRGGDAREFSRRAQRLFREVLGSGHPLVERWNREDRALSKAASGQRAGRQTWSAWTWWRGVSFSR